MDFAAQLLARMRWPDPEVDAPPHRRTAAVRAAERRAASYIREACVAKWAAQLNTCRQMAPSTAQVLQRWDTVELAAMHAADSRPMTAMTARSRRRRLQIWKRRWGFRYGKMCIRDVFADGELLRKAVRPHLQIRLLQKSQLFDSFL